VAINGKARPESIPNGGDDREGRLFLNGSEERSCGAAGGGTETEKKIS
jgi:hypothetical protein